jgi:hypothetical protein
VKNGASGAQKGENRVNDGGKRSGFQQHHVHTTCIPVHGPYTTTIKIMTGEEDEDEQEDRKGMLNTSHNI